MTGVHRALISVPGDGCSAREMSPPYQLPGQGSIALGLSDAPQVLPAPRGAGSMQS